VPTTFGYMNLAGGLSYVGLPFDRLDLDFTPVVDVSHMTFCDPAATVALAAFAATALRKTGQSVRFEGWEPQSYLSRIGLKKFAGQKDDFPGKRLVSDRVTNLMEVVTSADRRRVREDVLDVLDVQHAGARVVLGYCLEEMLRNVDDHAESPVHALLQAQYYDNRHQVVMAIADTGRGVRNSLLTRHDVPTDEAALKEAIRPGVSGRNTRKGTNAGLGLTTSSALVTKVGGTFQLLSGDCLLEIRKGGQSVHPLRNTRWPGVIVVMVVPRDDNLDWTETFTSVMEGL
jgi:hypothetical protein